MNKTEEMKEFFNECIIKDLINSEDLAINYMKVAKDYIEQLETEEQKLIEINDKYLQKLVYALTPTQHALGDNYNNEFKKIIADNIDLETCKIKRLLKECWGTDKY